MVGEISVMSWWGKLIGAVFGWMLAGPFGALLGLWLGHRFDRAMNQRVWVIGGGREARQRSQQAFFEATFRVMGCVAKSDGVVTADEIRVAQAVMDRLQLDDDSRAQARQFFREGKQSQFDLHAALSEFREACSAHPLLLQMFMSIQLQAAYADGEPTPKVRQLLKQICQGIGYSLWGYQRLEEMMRFHRQQSHQWGQSSGYSYQQRAQRPSRPPLHHAYAVLEVEPKVSDAELKKAYRKLMSKYHPDKLIAQGLPESMIKVATEKAQEIQTAYDQIREARQR